MQLKTIPPHSVQTRQPSYLSPGLGGVYLCSFCAAFSLDDLFMVESGIFKCPTIVLDSLRPLGSVNICFVLSQAYPSSKMYHLEYHAAGQEFHMLN